MSFFFWRNHIDSDVHRWAATSIFGGDGWHAPPREIRGSCWSTEIGLHEGSQSWTFEKKTTFKHKTPAKKIGRHNGYGAFFAIFRPFKNLKTWTFIMIRQFRSLKSLTFEKKTGESIDNTYWTAEKGWGFCSYANLSTTMFYNLSTLPY